MTLTTAEFILAQVDPLLGEVISRHGHIESKSTHGYFEALSSSIVGQQISVKAAAKIFNRFQDITDLQPEKVAHMSDEDIKAIGLSGRKSQYLRDLAEHFLRDSAVFNHLHSLPDDEVVSELTKVKGIGVWTAQMFLIFTLHRPDVFAPDDRGLQLAVEKLYDRSFTRSELSHLAEKWSPYCSTACLHLWRSLENEPKLV